MIPSREMPAMPIAEGIDSSKRTVGTVRKGRLRRFDPRSPLGQRHRLFLAMADPSTHPALLSTDFSSSFSSFLGTHLDHSPLVSVDAESRSTSRDGVFGKPQEPVAQLWHTNTLDSPNEVSDEVLGSVAYQKTRPGQGGFSQPSPRRSATGPGRCRGTALNSAFDRQFIVDSISRL
jgi:hypothetical protein